MAPYPLVRLACLSLCLVLSDCLHAAEWGILTGRFVVNGAVPPKPTIVQNVVPGVAVVDESIVVGRGGALRNALIYLRTKNPTVAPSYAATAADEVVLDIKNLRFEPHMVVMRTSQSLKITNSDGVNCTPRFEPMLNAAWNSILAAGGGTAKQKLTLAEVLPIKVSDSTHPWIAAWLVVRDDPYAIASAADGRFIIKDLPTDTELEFQLWHERAGYLKNVEFQAGVTDAKGRFRITLSAGDNSLGDIVVPADVLLR